MDESSDPLTTGAPADLRLSHRRILTLMLAISFVGMVVGMLAVDIRFGIGVAAGSAVAFVNYFWQRRSMRRIFEKAARGETPFFPAFAYIFRYVLVGLLFWLVYVTGVMSVFALIAGFAVFAIAIVVEGLIGIFNTPQRR